MRPFRANPSFFGREKELDEIRAALDPQSRTHGDQVNYALCGLGGMGKTQIVVAYAFECIHNMTFKIVLFAHADTKSKLDTSFNEFAYALGLVESTSEDFKTTRKKLQQFLHDTGKPDLMTSSFQC